MPVPASYNDITQDKAIRDHVGIVWYDRTFYVPRTWNSNVTKVWLRFGGVNYAAEVVRSYLLMAFWCLSVTHNITGALSLLIFGSVSLFVPC